MQSASILKYIYIFNKFGILCLVFTLSCQNRRNVNSFDQAYLSTKAPYGIIDDSVRILRLPDSLKPLDFLKGTMVLSLYVSDTLQLDGINLHFLKFYTIDTLESLHFLNENLSPISIHQYPDSIQPYASFALEYASNLKVYQTSELKRKAKYMLSVMRRLE